MPISEANAGLQDDIPNCVSDKLLTFLLNMSHMIQRDCSSMHAVGRKHLYLPIGQL